MVGRPAIDVWPNRSVPGDGRHEFGDLPRFPAGVQLRGHLSQAAGAAFGDYDGDGFLDLMVTNYVDFHLDDLPGFGKSPNCKYRGIDVQCGPRGLKGAGDALFHNNGDGTFKDVAKSAGVDDPNGYYGMGVVWADFNNTGWPDIYIANDSTPKFLYKNLGNGKFVDIGLESGTAVSEDGSEQASMGIAIGDSRRLSRKEYTICAAVATVSVSKKGEVRVERFDVAMDTGPFLVNPLAAERQVEMQVTMGLAATLRQEITIEKGRVVQSNFDDYPLLRATEIPEIGVHWVRATDDPIAGIGEEVVGWVAPAVCNAIFAATGKRIRSLPLKNHDLSWT